MIGSLRVLQDSQKGAKGISFSSRIFYFGNVKFNKGAFKDDMVTFIFIR